jgi:hypothetical protein
LAIAGLNCKIEGLCFYQNFVQAGSEVLRNFLPRQARGHWQQAEKTTKMNKIFDTYRPEGFGTVNGYLFVENPKKLIDFLKNAFYAEEINRSTNPENGDRANVILKNR